ncbi:MAG: transposase domain-containing protein [Steroidobacteraceae bacterium]
MTAKQKVAVVAGVGPGNGAALARRFAAGGYAMAMLARSRASLEPLEREIDGARGFKCDVGVPESVADFDTENRIRPFAQGRRVWLFCHNAFGARASANLFSLVSTARANGIEPHAYLNFIFERLPSADTVEALEALLPWKVRTTLLAARHGA